MAFDDGTRKKFEPPKSTVHEDLICPICHKGIIREMPDTDGKSGSFFCSDWKNSNCHFRIWKNSFQRDQGPKIEKEQLVKLLEDGTCSVDGKGILKLEADTIKWIPEGDDDTSFSCQMVYIPREDNNKKGKTTSKAKTATKKGSDKASASKGRTSTSSKVGSVICPICKKGQITENQKAFGCSEWRNGCKFTIWKNCLERAGGPLLNEEIVNDIFRKGKFVASGTTVILNNSKLLFYKVGTDINGKADYVVPLTH